MCLLRGTDWIFIHNSAYSATLKLYLSFPWCYSVLQKVLIRYPKSTFESALPISFKNFSLTQPTPQSKVRDTSTNRNTKLPPNSQFPPPAHPSISPLVINSPSALPKRSTLRYLSKCPCFCMQECALVCHLISYVRTIINVADNLNTTTCFDLYWSSSRHP